MITQFFSKAKDGGPTSPVDGYFLVEIKNLFSIALLKFNKGGREEFHTHAFHAFTWFLFGHLVEQDIDGSCYTYRRGLIPKLTKRGKNHRVRAFKDSWCFTIRGPWSEYWTEYTLADDMTTVLSNHRVVFAKEKGVVSLEDIDKRYL